MTLSYLKLTESGAPESWPLNCTPASYSRFKEGRQWPILNGCATSISEPFSSGVIQQRAAAGWQMVAIEWRRELPDAEAPTGGEFDEGVPYGLRVSDDCKRLEADPAEHRALMLMMELVTMDCSYSEIVATLNEEGYRMRNGQPWNRVAVFRMIPRLIEVGPRFFSSEEWVERLRHFENPHNEEAADQPRTNPHSWRNLFKRR